MASSVFEMEVCVPVTDIGDDAAGNTSVLECTARLTVAQMDALHDLVAHGG